MMKPDVTEKQCQCPLPFCMLVCENCAFAVYVYAFSHEHFSCFCMFARGNICISAYYCVYPLEYKLTFTFLRDYVRACIVVCVYVYVWMCERDLFSNN